MELNRAFGVFGSKRAASRFDQGVPPTALLSIDDESAMPPMALSLFQQWPAATSIPGARTILGGVCFRIDAALAAMRSRPAALGHTPWSMLAAAREGRSDRCVECGTAAATPRMPSAELLEQHAVIGKGQRRTYREFAGRWLRQIPVKY